MKYEYCPYCMKPMGEEEQCGFCKKEPNKYEQLPHHISVGSYLMERYYVGASLGEGGFGITYLGLDVKLNRKVAIKEFFPRSIVWREVTQSTTVNCYTKDEDVYKKGCEQFLAEARLLAHIENSPEIVQVYDFFRENNTAYIVMEYLEGQTLKDRVKENGIFSPSELFALLEPVVKRLSAIHNSGLIHRDISPDNLMLLNNGKVKLMDFGCARETNIEHTMTVMLKPGFAPPEQYYGHKQGPWTDVYAFCATIYYCLTGKLPPASIMRVANDELEAPSKLGVKISVGQEAALLKGLSPNTETRYKTMDELYEGLYNAKAFVLPSFAKKNETQKAADSGKTVQPKKAAIAAAAVASTTKKAAEKLNGLAKTIKEKKPSVKKTATDNKEEKKATLVSSLFGKTDGLNKTKKIGLFVMVGIIVLLCALLLFAVLHRHSDFCASKVEREPTCSAEGVIEYRCICLKKWTESIPKTEHTAVVKNSVEPTCADDGMTEGSYCSVCKSVIKAQGVIPAKGHGEIDKNGNCTVCNQFLYTPELKFTLNPDGKSYAVTQNGYYSTRELVIPEVYNGLPVTTIAQITECETLNIPSSITTIAPSAFMYNPSLKYITIPATVTSIGENAFSNTTLESITIEAAITTIEYGMFYENIYLKEVILPSTVTRIGSYAFSGCVRLTSIALPSELKSIGEYAFSFTSLTTVLLPDGVETVEQSAFVTETLELVGIPASVKTVGMTAFEGNLQMIHCEAQSQPEGWHSMWTIDKSIVYWGSGRGG